MSVAQVTAVLILDHDGGRIAAKYYLGPENGGPAWAEQGADGAKGQLKFEKQIMKKVCKLPSISDNMDVIVVDDYHVLISGNQEIYCMILAHKTENELAIMEVANAAWECMGLICGGTARISKKTVLMELTKVMLLLDELCENGMPCEIDAASLHARIEMADHHQDEPGAAASPSPTKDSGQSSFQAAINSAKSSVLGSLLSRAR
mmetsp:Transcript_84694/g.226395  ORF Transcript_84694/g.226395 Transcript_84694/m.226395 type:complete len:205 (-) Transcript_84694:181-795(-)